MPWSGYLAVTLPDEYATGQWRLTWVGFDLALAGCLALGLWLGLRRRRAAVPLLAATAALLFSDAWFDISLGWASPELAGSIALALLVEIPFGVLLLVWARRLISDGMRHRQARSDPWFERAMAAEFGPWGHGERAVAHLSGPELADFVREYQELSSRYCLLRPGPATGTREVAIRWYAFPHADPAD